MNMFFVLFFCLFCPLELFFFFFSRLYNSSKRHFVYILFTVLEVVLRYLCVNLNKQCELHVFHFFYFISYIFIYFDLHLYVSLGIIVGVIRHGSFLIGFLCPLNNCLKL